MPKVDLPGLAPQDQKWAHDPALATLSSEHQKPGGAAFPMNM